MLPATGRCTAMCYFFAADFLVVAFLEGATLDAPFAEEVAFLVADLLTTPFLGALTDDEGAFFIGFETEVALRETTDGIGNCFVPKRGAKKCPV